MALHPLFTIENPDKYYSVGGYPVPDTIDIFYNSGTDAITLSHTPLANNYIGNRAGEISPFFFCTGDVLSQFKIRTNGRPFVDKVETPNAAACQIISVCDAYIQEPLLITDSPIGLSQGTVIIRGTTTKPFKFNNGAITTTEYKVDNGAWSNVPVFSNLAEGPHTAYMRDAEGCIATKDFIINGQPIYEPRFVCSYKDSANKTTRIEIQKRNYEGAPEEVLGAATPLVIKEHADDMFTEIRGQEAIISFLADREFHYLELFTGDHREFRVKVYKEEVLKWTGWLVPDVYTEPYIAPPFAVTFSATDGLGELKNIPFSDGRPEGEMHQLGVITYILEKLKTFLSFSTAINLYETRMQQSDADDVLSQAAVNFDTYQTDGEVWSCAQVLEAILKPYGAFIRQSEGMWHIVRLEELKGSYVRRLYNYNGYYLGNETVNPTVLITGPQANPATRFHWIEGNQELEMRPGLKHAEVHIDYRLRDNLIPGGNIKEEDFFFDQTTMVSATHRHFEGTALIFPVITDFEKNEVAMFFPYASGDAASAQFRQSENIFIYKDGDIIAGDDPCSLKIDIEYRVLGELIPNMPAPEMLFSLQFGDGYLSSTWFGGRVLFTGVFHQIKIPVTSLNSWQTLSIITDVIPKDAWANIRVYDVASNGNVIAGIQYRKIGVTVVKPYFPIMEKEETFISTASRLNYHTPPVVEAVHGDVIPFNNARSMFENLLMVNGLPSLDWKRKGKDEALPLLKLLANTRISLNEQPKKLLRGKLKGAFTWDQVIQEAVVLTRYLPVGFEYNDRENTISAEFMELLGTSQALEGKRLLLETEAAILFEDNTFIGLEG